MHPLTVTWAPHIYTEWGWKNFQSWVHSGFDNFLHTPNGRTHRLLTRLAVENLFHPFQAFMLGQKSLAPKMALLHDLPLVFYGENEAEYGNPRTDTDTAKRDWSYYTAEDKSQIFLGGVSVHDLINTFGVPEVDLLPYFPADPVQIEKKNDRGALSRLLSEVASAELLLPRGRAHRLPGVARAHARHLQQVQQHRRPDRRLPLLHDLHQVRHRPHDLRRGAGDPLARHHPRGGRGARPPLRRRIPRALRRGNLRLPEHPREGIPGRIQDVRAADHGPAVLHASRRPLPLAASVEVRRGEWKLRHTSWQHTPMGKDYKK